MENQRVLIQSGHKKSIKKAIRIQRLVEKQAKRFYTENRQRIIHCKLLNFISNVNRKIKTYMLTGED